MKIATYHVDRKSYANSNVLMNVSTSEACSGTIKVHNANNFDESLMSVMKSLSVFDFSFKEKDMVETIPTKSSIAIDNKTVQMDSLLLF